MNLERLIARSLSLPRSIRMSMRRQIKERPLSNISYLPLVNDLSDAMIRAYTLGYRSNGSTLRRDSRTAQHAIYRKMAREALKQYQSSANQAIHAAYRNARAAGSSKSNAAIVAMRRFASLGHTAPVTNRLDTLYRSAMRSAFQQGRFDASRTDPAIWGYRFIAREVRGEKHPTTRDSHWQYHGVTLPKEHPFWNEIWPPLEWNCYCTVKFFKRKQKIQRPPPVPIPLQSSFRGQAFELQ